MMKNIKNFTFLLILFYLESGSQTFINKGNIIFERKIQMHKIFENNNWVKDRLNEIPKFYISNFQLQFNTDTVVYQMTGEDDPNSLTWAIYANENKVTTVFSKAETIVKETVFDESFVIKDSLKKFQWKLVNETRNIAGIECKKATTIINDSIFVVAFYAERIPVSGGPEQFNGLPGMILGVVIPKLHVSYYARKVELKEKPDIKFPPNKGTTMKRDEFYEMILKNMKWAFTESNIGALYIFL